MQFEYKEVDFKKYCETCEHKDVNEVKDPCHECLSNPANSHSKKPINYKKKEEK